MKNLAAIILVSMLYGDASAQSTQQPHEIIVSGSQIRQNYPSDLGNVWYDEFEKIKGTYYFANGKSMHLWMWGNRMYAEIDGKNKFLLVAVSPYVFIARNQQVRITIEDPDVSSGDNHATVVLAASLLSSFASKDELVTLLATNR
jgi:hypothetical protein